MVQLRSPGGGDIVPPCNMFLQRTRLQTQRHLDGFRHFCTAHGSVLSGMSFPQKLPIRMHGGSGPPPYRPLHACLGPPESIIQTISTGSAVFAQLKPHIPYTLKWGPFSPKLPLAMTQ